MFPAVALFTTLVFTLSAFALSPREKFSVAKQVATVANFRNDQAGLRTALAAFDSLAPDQELATSVLYHAAWTEWMIAASQFEEKKPADAVVTLESGIARLRRSLELRPDDGEAHALLAWMLMAVASSDRTRLQELGTQVREHRKRALELAPHSPRAVMLDATMMLYSPQPGMLEKGLARWQETLQLVETEAITDPTLPNWGRILADGWLANLYLNLKPPHIAEARMHAEKALRERPDFWWVANQVLPKTKEP